MKILCLAVFFALITTLISCYSTSEKPKQNTSKAQALATLLSDSSAFVREFAERFALGEFPYTAKIDSATQDTIAAPQVLKYIFEPAQKAGLRVFADFWGDEELNATTRKGLEDRFINPEQSVFMVLNVLCQPRLHFHEDYYTLLFKVVPTFMEGDYAYTYLANYNKKGELIDAIQVAANADYVDMQTLKESKINAEGKIATIGKTIRRGGMEDGSRDFTEFAYLNYTLNPVGKFEITKESYTGLSGNFSGKESKEMLKIDQFGEELHVFYQATAEAPLDQELEIIQHDTKKNTLIVQLPESSTRFTLTYDKDRKALTCKKSDGSSVDFVRSRN